MQSDWGHTLAALYRVRCNLFPSANDGGTVAFAATLQAGGAGIFTVDDGQIVQILDTEGAFESWRGH
jgi:hypothetical protein